MYHLPPGNHIQTICSNLALTFRNQSILYCLVICILFQPDPSVASDPAKLRLYTWEDYIPEQVLTRFYQESGIRILEIHYETDDLKEELIQQTGGQGLDLIIGSGYKFMSYLKRGGIIARLNPEAIPNLNHIDGEWYNKFPELKNHAVPYLWGTIGIAYRKDLIKHPVSSWKDILQPAESLRGKIMMINDYRDVLGATFKYLGYSLNTTDSQAISLAHDYLSEQRPYVSSYGYFDLNETSELITGSVWMAMAYNGDALLLNQLLDAVAYVVPEEGSNIWVDFIGVLAKSRYKKEAGTFINYINSPEIAALIANELNYATPNKAAMQNLPKEHLTNPLIYPPEEVLEKSEIYKTLPGKVISRYNNVFLNVVTQNDDSNPE